MSIWTSLFLHICFSFCHHIENGAFGGELSPQSEGRGSSKSISPPAYPGARDLSEVRVWPGPCLAVQRQYQPPTAGLGQVPERAGYQGTLCPGSNTRYGIKNVRTPQLKMIVLLNNIVETVIQFFFPQCIESSKYGEICHNKHFWWRVGKQYYVQWKPLI